MTDPSNAFQLKSAFMESALSKSFHRDGQAIFESIYSSKPVIFADDIITPAASLPLAADQATLDAWIAVNTGILQKYTDWVLTPDAVSNNQLYYIDDGGWQRPFILEYMVPNPLTNQPSNGYVLQLKQGAGGASPGTQISPALGQWFCNPFEGGFHFEAGATPVDLGWGAITATVYVFIGTSTSELIGSIGSVPDCQIDAGGFITVPYDAFCRIDGGSFI